MMPAAGTEPGLRIGPVGERFWDVSRIAVLRGGGLGDLIFALPAIEALAAAYPAARITLLGNPLHRELVELRVPAITEVEILPFAAGVRDGDEDPAALEAFFDRLGNGHFDLVVQLHGGGRFSNPFLSRLGARHSVGSRTPDALALERYVPYVYYQHEVLRDLEVVGLAGALPVTLEPRLQVTGRDLELARQALPSLDGPLIAIHPGATDPRRRWPAERFAEVAARLCRGGLNIVVVGDPGDRELARSVVDLTRDQLPAGRSEAVFSLAGELGIAGLVGVLARTAVLLGNDSGPRHLAQAVGAATVGIFWAGNVINAGPMGRSRHRVELSWTTACPICGQDASQVGWTAERCEHDPSYVTDVRTDDIYDDVTALLAGGQLRPDPAS